MTEDGYILQLHRLPPRADGHGSPVYLQHGLLCRYLHTIYTIETLCLH